MSHTLQWIIRFLHVFVGITVANAAVSEGKSCVGVVVGPCPFFLVVLQLWRRNASLAGGFAGRLVVWWWLCFCDLICPFLVQANCAYVPFFSPLMSLSGPCHSAITANPEEKKTEGKSCVGVVVGPCPFFLVVLQLWRRNASLAGGFAGRLVVWWWLCFCDLICPFLVQANCAYVPFFSPLMSLSGPCHSAITANPEEKKSNWHGGCALMFLTIRLNGTLEMMQNDVKTSEFGYRSTEIDLFLMMLFVNNFLEKNFVFYEVCFCQRFRSFWNLMRRCEWTRMFLEQHCDCLNSHRL